MGDARGFLHRATTGSMRLVLGPWPFYPTTVAIVAAYGMLIRGIVRVLTQVEHAPAYLGLLLPNLITGLVVVLAAWAGMVLLPRLVDRVAPLHGRPGGRLRYVGTIVVICGLMTGALLVMARQLLPDGHLPSQAGLAAIALSTAFVVLITVGFTNSLTGLVRQRFQREEDLLAERLELVRAERTMQLAAEERVRAETARYLHDDMQTALLRASMRLAPLAKNAVAPEERATLEAAIAEIDGVRDNGVRAIGRILAPPLHSTGLIVALGELATTYDGVMAVDVEFCPAAAKRFRIVGEGDRMALAVYRLAEQALQNALKHGQAAMASVKVSVVTDGATQLLVEADGLAPPDDRVPGDGAAITNAWLDDVGGGWSLGAGERGGSCFCAVIGRANGAYAGSA